MSQRFFTKFCTLFTASIAIGFLSNSCHAAKKGVLDYVNNTAQDGVYSLFNLIFSRNGVWVLLALAAFVAYLFWRKS